MADSSLNTTQNFRVCSDQDQPIGQYQPNTVCGTRVPAQKALSRKDSLQVFNLIIWVSRSDAVNNIGDCNDNENESDLSFNRNKLKSIQTKDQPVILNKKKDTVKEELSPLPFLKQGISLKSDKMFGWKPTAGKLDITPIPLCFGLVEYNINELIQPEKIVYLGVRYQNSFKIHENYANKTFKMPYMKRNLSTGLLEREIINFESYSFKLPKISQLGDIKYEDAFQCFSQSMSQNDENYNQIKQQLKLNLSVNEAPLNGTLSLKFDSDFESGNLDLAARTFHDSNDEYDLIMRLDSNSRTHQQWFYFCVDTEGRGQYKNLKVRFNILNFTKPYSLYQQGMQPMVWSERHYQEQGIGWHRGGQEIQYQRGRLKRQNYKNNCSCLSFEYQFQYESDKVFFAYGTPYTFSMLNSFIKKVQQIQQESQNASNQIFKTESCGQSLGGVQIPLLTITDFSCTELKKTILINGRTHPGETNASWVLHGFIRFLLSKQPQARLLRKRAIFKIIPILNIDGVIAGNYRTGFAGLDINRMFGEKSNKRLNPEAFMLKDYIKIEKRLSFYFDVHGHSSKKSVFMYGPRFPMHSEHYLNIRILPKLLSQRTQMFRYYSCRFANEPSKRNCSRLAFSREIQLPNCYTIETSMMGYINQNRQTVDLDISSLMDFSQNLCQSLLDWFQLMYKQKMERIKRAIKVSSVRKQQQRSIAEILGNEDYEEYKQEIEQELKRVQSQNSSILKKKVSKTKSSHFQQTSNPVKQKKVEDLVESDSTDSDQNLNNISEVHMVPTLKMMEPEPPQDEKSGFDIPLMCGFEWFEPPQPKVKPEPKEKPRKQQNNFTSFYGMQQEYELGLNHLEDIYQEIKQDIQKAQSIQNQRRKVLQTKGARIKDKELDLEDELDSQKGNSSNDSEPEVQDEKQQELDELKIQDCLIHFFKQIEQAPHEISSENWRQVRPHTAVRTTGNNVFGLSSDQIKQKTQASAIYDRDLQKFQQKTLKTFMKETPLASDEIQLSPYKTSKLANTQPKNVKQLFSTLDQFSGGKQIQKRTTTFVNKISSSKKAERFRSAMKMTQQNPVYKLVPESMQSCSAVQNNRIIIQSAHQQPSIIRKQKRQIEVSKINVDAAKLGRNVHVGYQNMFTKNSMEFISHLQREFNQGSHDMGGKYQHVNDQMTNKILSQEQKGNQIDAKTKQWYQQQLWHQLAKFASSQLEKSESGIEPIKFQNERIDTAQKINKLQSNTQFRSSAPQYFLDKHTFVKSQISPRSMTQPHIATIQSDKINFNKSQNKQTTFSTNVLLQDATQSMMHGKRYSQSYLITDDENIQVRNIQVQRPKTSSNQMGYRARKIDRGQKSSADIVAASIGMKQSMRYVYEDQKRK